MARHGPLAWLLSVAVLLSGCAAGSRGGAEHAVAEDDGRKFWPVADVQAEVNAAIERARAEDRLLLIVLGANWCHDSRALAARLNQDPLRGVVEQNYETVLVDVGYLDRGREVTRWFGSPIYYATPTVLIVEPGTGRLLNAEDRHQWGSASKIGMDDSVAYFSGMARRDRGAIEMPSPELQGVYALIDAYEERMAERVVRGYEHLGPMLRTYKEGGTPPERFREEWDEVSSFRNELPFELERTRAEARSKVAMGETGYTPALTEYPPYSWEAER